MAFFLPPICVWKRAVPVPFQLTCSQMTPVGHDFEPALMLWTDKLSCLDQGDVHELAFKASLMA